MTSDDIEEGSNNTRAINYDESLAITREIHWVGFLEEGSRLRCNPYLLIDGKGDDVILFDPGSIPDFPKVMRKVIDLVPPQKITGIVVSHQDPDVCGNLAVIEDIVENPNLKIYAHLNTIRLIAHLGLVGQLQDIAKIDNRLTLSSGRILDFIPLLYLHSPGAIATLDRQTKSLFSGDVFGAIGTDNDLFSADDFPHSMDSFHQAYMPSNKVLRPAMDMLSGLQIDRILPQHGAVLEGDDVAIAIEHLRRLPCGVDLMEV
ncbi:MAG: MBL fold metallo-hydrolase [Alphaproteobacteria bacterium]|jgi:flavorubredoxin|nr:MBL fold metallo-hydrolase [Alphaproteobacteria bacterium]MDP6832579.1 MBL fold metallo-hydrolase [Alphaproteobacteria bacterium]MDP6874601.1 MBL fold metallo-hydrolase [Alphaproteobacteria bacterium]